MITKNNSQVWGVRVTLWILNTTQKLSRLAVAPVSLNFIDSTFRKWFRFAEISNFFFILHSLHIRRNVNKRVVTDGQIMFENQNRYYSIISFEFFLNGNLWWANEPLRKMFIAINSTGFIGLCEMIATTLNMKLNKIADESVGWLQLWRIRECQFTIFIIS